MSTVVPKKVRKSGAGAKHVSSHPPYGQMVKMALKTMKERKGSSRAAILKYLFQNYKFGGNMVSVNSHLRMALKRGVETGVFKQVKGIGASGSFRLGETKSVGSVKKAKKPKAKKTSTVRKSTGVKKVIKKSKKSKSGGVKRKSASKAKKTGVKKVKRASKKHTKKVVKH